MGASETTEHVVTEANDFFWAHTVFYPKITLRIQDDETLDWDSIETRIREVLGRNAWISENNGAPEQVALTFEKIRNGEYVFSSDHVWSWGERERRWYLTPRKFHAFGQYYKDLAHELTRALRGTGIYLSMGLETDPQYSSIKG